MGDRRNEESSPQPKKSRTIANEDAATQSSRAHCFQPCDAIASMTPTATFRSVIGSSPPFSCSHTTLPNESPSPRNPQSLLILIQSPKSKTASKLKVDSLRKGKSEVIERNHILVLGWNDKLGSLLKQLAIANKSVGGGVVVVLAERDKEEMEMDIAKLEFDFMGTSVICRSGSPLILADLKKSKRLPYKETKPTSLQLTAFSYNSWIREMQQDSDKSIIISEILDSRTRNLVSVSRISDYVLSNELVSMVLAMVAEDKQINCVLEELFAEEDELCFYDIMVRGRQRREVVIGYRLANAKRAVINPSQKSAVRKWSHDDVFVVISTSE